MPQLLPTWAFCFLIRVVKCPEVGFSTWLLHRSHHLICPYFPHPWNGISTLWLLISLQLLTVPSSFSYWNCWASSRQYSFPLYRQRVQALISFGLHALYNLHFSQFCPLSLNLSCCLRRPRSSISLVMGLLDQGVSGSPVPMNGCLRFPPGHVSCWASPIVMLSEYGNNIPKTALVKCREEIMKLNEL